MEPRDTQLSHKAEPPKSGFQMNQEVSSDSDPGVLITQNPAGQTVRQQTDPGQPPTYTDLPLAAWTISQAAGWPVSHFPSHHPCSTSSSSAHQRRWRGWHRLHSARRTRGPSSHPWSSTVPPRCHTLSRWACLPRSAQTHAFACCASPRHWGPRPGPQSHSRRHPRDYSLRLQDPKAHSCMMGPLFGAVVTARWRADPSSRILKGNSWWVIWLWTPRNPMCPRTYQISTSASH